MVDKISVNPESVRCLGNIVSPKTQSDFDLYNSSIVPSTATINDVVKPVFGVNYRNGEYIILDYNPFEVYSEEMSTFNVKATLHKPGGDVYPGQTLSCVLSTNDVLSGRTNSKGQVTFDIPASVGGVYEFRVSYNSTDNGGCSKTGKVVVGDLNNIKLVSEKNINDLTDDNRLFATVNGEVNGTLLTIPGVPVYFYEEYVYYDLLILPELGDEIQVTDVNPIHVIVRDEDGSRVPNQTVYLYEEYDAGTLRITNLETGVENTDEIILSATLRNSLGGAIADETVSFYEEYEENELRVNIEDKIIGDATTTVLTASIRDTDGSIVGVSGTNIDFYEEYDLSNIGLTAMPAPITIDDETTLTATLSDEDGSRVYGASVYFTKEIPGSNDYEIELDSTASSITVDGTATLTVTVVDEDDDPVEDVHVLFYGDGDLFPEEIVVPVRGNSLSLTTDVRSITVGGSVACTGVLLNGDGEALASKTVKFYDGTTLLGSDTTDSDGVVEYTYTPASVGACVLSCVFEDEENGDVTSNRVNVTVSKIASTISLSAADSSVSYGSSISLSGTVSVGSGASVKIYRGSTLVDTVTSTTDGAFSKTVGGLSVGDYTFTAVYAGDTTHTEVTSSEVSVSVVKATPTISLSAASSSVTVGSSVSLTGSLSISSNVNVKIYQGNTLIDTVTSSSGSFSKTVTGLSAGSYTFKATYEGSSNYNSVTSSDVNVTVSKSTPTLSLSASSNSITAGESLTLSGTLSAGSGLSVMIISNNSLVDTVTTGTGGAFSKTITPGAGTYTYIAMFNGNSSYNNASSSAVSVSVSEATATLYGVSLTSDKSVLSHYHSESAVLSAFVYDTNEDGVSGETVEFFKGSTSLGTATTDSNGVATKTYASTGSGDVSFTATCSSVTSSPVTVEDCYYVNTGETTSLTIDTGVSCTIEDGAIKISKNTSGEKFVTCNYDYYNTNQEITFKVPQINSSTNVPLGFAVYRSDGTQIYWAGYNKSNGKFDSKGGSKTTTLSAGDTIRIVKSGSTLTAYKNETSISSVSTATNGIRLAFYTNNNYVQYIDDIKVKPL